MLPQLVPNPDSFLTVNRAALVQQREEDEFSRGTHLVDLRDHEFVCPMCRRLGNTLLPALTPPSPPLHPSGLPPKEGLLQSQAEILASSSEEGEHRAETDYLDSFQVLPCAVCIHRPTCLCASVVSLT